MPSTQSPAHRAAVARKRRTILQFDAMNIIEENNTASLKAENDFQGFLDRAFDAIDHVPNQVDAVYWDMMYAGDCWSIYPSKLLPQRRTGRYGKWQDQGHDLFRALVEGGRQRGLENILVHRIGETDVDAEQHPNHHKQQHPEMYIKTWLWSGMPNLAVKEIRERKLAILREPMENYAFDGLQIDFCRHTPFLPPGQQWELRDQVTLFMSMLRDMLTELEGIKGCPLLLCARVPETVEGCAQDGLDVVAWAREGIVDCLTLGSRNYHIDIPAFRRALAGTCVKLFPSVDGHHCTDGYSDASMEIHRAVFSNWWDMGCDGISLFNWFSARHEMYRDTTQGAFTMVRNSHMDCMREAGDPDALRLGDKTFVAERRGGYPWEDGYANNNHTKPLPLRLPNDARAQRVTLYLADPVSLLRDQVRSLRLVLVLSGLGAEDALDMAVNAFLTEGEREDGWKDPQIQKPGQELVSGYHTQNLPALPDQRLSKITCALEPGVLFKGENHVVVALRRKGKYPYCAAVWLERVEIAVTYRH